MSDLTFEQLAAELRSAGQNIDAVVAPVVKQTASKVEATQKANVAKRTGRTQKSIKATGPNGSKFTKTTIEAEIGPTWYVGRLIELGTATQPPRPFVANSLDPHIDAHTDAVLNSAADALLKGHP